MKKIMWIIILLCLSALTGVAAADDTDIYGTNEIAIPPNVLIIFDTSGSMREVDVPSEYYDPATTYPIKSGIATNTVYRRYKSGQSYVWSVYATDVDSIQCAGVKNALLTKGFITSAGLKSAINSSCGSTLFDLYMGNWRNYDASDASNMRSRIDVAKDVITNLIDKTDNVRFGLMRFNLDDGGRIVCEMGSTKTQLKNAVNNFKAEDWTPLAETLAEAGLYFAGKQSWYNSKTTYTSPIQYKCQKNYIIIMTDGESTHDNDSRLYKTPYICGDIIGDYDGDGKDLKNGSPILYPDQGTDFLDDVALYLHVNDLRSDMGLPGERYEVQNISKIYTIGLRIDVQLLADTAQNGNGEYYVANSISGLEAAFETILADIAKVNSVFVSPVVPVSQLNRAYAGDRIYIGFFQPEANGRWAGNIKKFGLTADGTIIDKNGNDASDQHGVIKEAAQSYWSVENDGQEVKKGGVGQLLQNNHNRQIYTFLGEDNDLTVAANAFQTSNAALTAEMLEVGTAAERERIIKDIHGENRSWILGDILHSDPLVVSYGSQRVILVGSNDGMVHCFDDESGVELCAFIPPEQLGRLKLLSDISPVHEYFMDGSLRIHHDGSQKILFFGQRRGGREYYALDISSYTQPKWIYRIDHQKLGAGSEQLGQSWGVPTPVTIMKSHDTPEKVFLLPGGYDINQDSAHPLNRDAVGRAAFSINTATGALSSLNFSANGAGNADMTHCITDVVGIDVDGDKIVTRVYAPDLGGQIFAFEDEGLQGEWSKRRLFTASGGGVQRKIFHAPDIVTYTDDAEPNKIKDMLYFGTGNREDPRERSTVNRFYMVKNDWRPLEGFTTLTAANLVDVTDNLVQDGSAEQRTAALDALKAASGWYITLEHEGEKVTAPPVVYNKVVYFSTFTPTDEEGLPIEGDPCDTINQTGTGRLYAVDYLTGAAVFPGPTDPTTGEPQSPNKASRVLATKPGPVSPPVIVVLEGGPKLMYGVEGGVDVQDVLRRIDMHMYFWREMLN